MATYTNLLLSKNPDEFDLTKAYDYDGFLEQIEHENLSTIRTTILTTICVRALAYDITKSHYINMITPITVPSNIYEYKSFSIRMGVLIAMCRDVKMIGGISQLIAFKANNVQNVASIVKLLEINNINTIQSLVLRHTNNCKMTMTLAAQQAYITTAIDYNVMMRGLGFPVPHVLDTATTEKLKFFDDGHIYSIDPYVNIKNDETILIKLKNIFLHAIENISKSFQSIIQSSKH